MKKLSLFCFFLIGFMFLFVGNVVADKAIENYESVILDDFDSGTELNGVEREWTWVVRGSKFVTKDEEGVPILEWKLVDGYPDGLYRKKEVEGKDVRVLGVLGGFDRRGYNYLEIIPVTTDDEGKIISRPIEVKGVVKSISLWAWGSNYDYYVEVHLRDANGINYNLLLGSLAYEGWRNLNVHVPTSIPQHRVYIGKKSALVITKLVVWTKPNEKADKFSVFFDMLKIVSDTFITKFDGDEFADPEVIEELWTAGEEIQPK